MFWRQNAAQQQQEQELQQQKPQQQQQQQQAQLKRLNISFNVKIAVNVHTNMTTTNMNPVEQQKKEQITKNQQKSRVKRSLNGVRQHLTHWGRQLSNYSPGSGHGGISTVLIANLLMLLLLSFCCDVCRSQNEQQLNYTQSQTQSQSQNRSPLLPKLDSDVVEKVAVWLKHASAAPPSVVEGIAIRSGSGVTQHQEQKQLASSMATPTTSTKAASDERIALERVTRDCVQRCIVEEDLFLDEFGIRCERADSSEKCYKTRCTKGCAQWYRALKEFEPCQEACSSTQFYPFDMPCITACEMAQRHWWHLQRLVMTHLVETTQPQLLPHHATSKDGHALPLTIKWDIHFPENFLASRPFNIQYQIVQNKREKEEQQLDEQPDDWSNLADYDCDEYFACEILEGLMPYTNYRFRFELPFGESSADVLYSPATSSFRTAAEGAPISPPQISELLSLDHSHLAVHWRPGRYSNGPITGYRVKLEEQQPQAKEKQNSSWEQLLPATQLSWIFAGLQPQTNYTLLLTMINAQGEGPPASGSQLTQPLDSSPEQLNSVLLAGEYSIVWKSLEGTGEARTVYRSEQLLSDFAYEQRERRLFVIDVLGQLKSMLLEQPTTLTPLQLQNETQLKPRKLSLDWLSQRLFIAVEHPTEGFGLLSSDLRGGNIVHWDQRLPLPVQQLEVDPLNGWLFFRDRDNLWRIDLISGQRLALPVASTPDRFSLDSQHWLLHYLSHGQLHELSYDGRHSHKLEQLPTGDWQSFAYSSSSLLLANGSQLLRYNLISHNLDSWPLRELEWVWALLPLSISRQPLALKLGPPQQLTALLGVHAAQISWTAPALHVYQSSAAAASRNCSYELEVLDVASQSAYNIRNIRSLHFTVERLQADNLYQLRIRSLNAAGEAGDWTRPLIRRSWPLGEHRLRWATASGALYETDELGGASQSLPARLAANPGPLTMLNGSAAYYVDGSGLLQCVNLLHAELNCSVAEPAATVHHVGSVAYDWRGGRLYWSDLARDCVVRMNPSSGGRQRELLPIFGARQLALDSAHGHLYYTTLARLARRSLSGQEEREAKEYYHSNGLAGTGRISAFSLDLAQRQIFWLADGRLQRAPMDGGAVTGSGAVLLPEVNSWPSTLRHLPHPEALLWLSRDRSSAWLAREQSKDQQLALEQLIPAAVPLPLSFVQLREEEATLPPALDASVLPEQVAPESVRIDDGYWDDFHVRWQPVTTAENHTIHYNVLLEHEDGRLQTLELAAPFVRITELPQAHLSLKIAITPRTAWSAGPTTRVTLATPSAAPMQPKRLRVFVERGSAALQEVNISALVRWETPTPAQGQTQPGAASSTSYRVYCWHGTELHAEEQLQQNFSLVATPTSTSHPQQQHPLELRIEGLQPDETYTFQVQAGAGAATATHALHVAPEVQSVPRLIYATAEYIGELDLDTRLRRKLVHTASAVEHLALLQGEQRLLWVNENVELMTHVPGAPPAKLARMRAEVLSLTVDWLARVVYWAELELEQNGDESTQSAVIYRLELCQFEGKILHGERLWRISRGRLLRDLIALPHAQALLWLEFEPGPGLRNASLVGRNLSTGQALSYRINGGPLWRMFEGSLEPDSETLNMVDHAGKLCAYELARRLCTPLRVHFNVLADEIAEMSRDSGYIYALRNHSVRAYSRRKQQLEYLVDVAEVRLLQAYNYQAYPPKRCLLLPHQATTMGSSSFNSSLELKYSCEEMQCSLLLPALHAADDCYLPVPGLSYKLNITKFEEQSELRSLSGIAGSSLNISGLLPYTNYSVELLVNSYYQQKLGLLPLQLPSLTLLTAAATPSAPRNFSVRPLSPKAMEITWLAPLETRSPLVWYTLHWQQDLLSDKELNEVKQLRLEDEADQEAAHRYTLHNLEPNSIYDVWLHVHATPSKFNQSVTLSVRTYPALPPLQLLQVGAYSLNLSWAGSSDNLTALAVECQSLQPQEQRLHHELLLQSNHSLIIIEELLPKTRYDCRLAISYRDHVSFESTPTYRGDSVAFETLGDSPSAPGRPHIEHIAGEIFKVSWTAARGNGAEISSYHLEALQTRRRRRRRHLAQLPWAEEPAVIEDRWLDYCNTTELSCLVREMHSRRLVLFRVRARSEEFGWGPYSEDSPRMAEPLIPPEKRGSLVLAIVAPAAIVSSCVLALVLIRKVQKRRLRAKKLLAKSRPSIWSNLSAQQTQQQLMASRNRAFSMTSHSTLYTGGPLSDADIALLPQISWNQLTLLRFLGSGAFGEVYEGQLQYEDESQPERVAIKSLRKGASEFAELLQEAQLMSNFKHENIVGLIGVCFDSESISLVMEHMEAGDLLSYLRGARPSTEQLVATLQLSDLLAMCIDVANGCSYLEDMHFVHRDLACRNCLVSSADARRRVVKIGDFGLARDIYKSDYYRKEGEGLLPVRWMSPESLVDGVFTTHSDVWAFGVLCWEILTLGQQPYAARTNFDVLNHVKEGGRLQQPDQCPDKLYALLLQCWNTEPEERPSFRRCVNTLQTLSTDLRRAQMPASIGASGDASTAASTLASKPELKVRFDSAESDILAEAAVTPAMSTPTPEADFQLYSNEGVSRL